MLQIQIEQLREDFERERTQLVDQIDQKDKQISDMIGIYHLEVKVIEGMGFRIFMLIVVLLIPLIMLLFGWLFFRRTPKKINYVFGYRTKRSMRNKETWKFANQYFGKVWYLYLSP